MSLITRKIAGIEKVNLFYKGAVICGTNFSSGQTFAHGLTLKTKSPNIKTVTFAAVPASPQVPISMADIIAQIIAVDAALAPYVWRQGNVSSLVIVEAVPGSGVTIDKLGTVNSLFGLDGSNDTVGTYINAPGGGAPELVDIHPLENNTYLITTDE
jgi:hypothetical protein